MIGRRQARVYCQQHRTEYSPRPARTEFRFGDGSYPSLGTTWIRIPTPNLSYLEVDMDVVSADVLYLLGLDVLDREKLVADNVRNVLRSYLYNWELPITHKFGHLYVCWNTNETLFTKQELVKLHSHFRHPSSGKLFELIKRAKPDQADEGTRKMLDKISRACETCKTFSVPPMRFTVSLPPSEITFNREISLDLMWIDKKAALHVVDLEIHFSSAAFIDHKLWNLYGMPS